MDLSVIFAACFRKKRNIMAVTRLKRKAKRNKSRAAARQAKIKRLNIKPVIESVDVEAIKEEFAKDSKGSAKASKKSAKEDSSEKESNEDSAE